MLPNDRAQPAAPAVPGRLARALGSFRRAPLPLKIGLIVLAIILCGPEIGIVLLAAMAYGVYAVIKGRRSLVASVSVAVWGLVAAGAAGASSLALPAAHPAVRRSWRRPTPPRSPAGTCPAAPWPGRCFGRSPRVSRRCAAGPPSRSSGSPPPGCSPASCSAGGWPRACRRPPATGRSGSRRRRRAGRRGQARTGTAPSASRRLARRRPRPRRTRPPATGQRRALPEISVDEAMAELDKMIGLEPGQGAGQVDRRVDRGGADAGHGGLSYRQADAPLRASSARQAPARPPWRGSSPRSSMRSGCWTSRRDRSAAGRPGGGVSRRHRDQDQRACRLRAGRGAVHRRGVQPGERGRRAERPVRHRGGAGAAQAGRGRPGRPDHHPGRVREADGELPRLATRGWRRGSPPG